MKILILFWNISSGILEHLVIILLRDYYILNIQAWIVVSCKLMLVN